MRPKVVALVLMTGIAAGACTAHSTPSAGPYRAVHQYTCCRAADVDRVYRPGQMLTVHWIATAVSGESATPVPVTLRAGLSGGFTTIGSAKHSSARSGWINAEDVHVTELTGGSPVSRIVIPESTPAGFANLRISIREASTTQTAYSIIKITKHG